MAKIKTNRKRQLHNKSKKSLAMCVLQPQLHKGMCQVRVLLENVLKIG